MPKTGKNIYKRKDGRWEGRYIICRIGGKTKYGYVYSHSYAETKEKLIKAVAKENKAICEARICTGTFGGFAAEWLVSSGTYLKESSIVRYGDILRLYVYPYFENVPVSNITNEDISGLAKELLSNGGRSGGGLSAGTVSTVFTVIKSVFKFISAKGIVIRADTSTVTLKQHRKDMRVFGIEEQKKLSDFLCGDLTLDNLGILLCLYTGLRVGELCALKWGDISAENKTITVNKTMQRLRHTGGEAKTTVTVTPPKSSCSVRTIPIPEAVSDILRKYDFDGDTYFLTGRADKYIEPRTMQNRFKAVLKKCGIGTANFHALRHTFATRCVELGFDIKSLSEILGHASVNITLSRYVHPSMELKQKNMDKLSELLYQSSNSVK